MSAPAIKYKNKVFAFFHQSEMGFKLGKGYDLSPFDIQQFSYLSPFKHKPPMKAWYMIGEQDSDKWETLAYEAFAILQTATK